MGVAGCDGKPILHFGTCTYTVQKYDVELDLAAPYATTAVTLTTTSSGQCLTIGFQPASADAATLGGATTTDVVIDAANHTLTACDPAGYGWPQGTTLTLSVSAAVSATTLSSSDVGFSSHVDGDGATFTYLLSWVGGCSRHGPCDAAPDCFAAYSFTVHHAPETQVLCPGSITPGPNTTVCDFRFDGPSYSTFAVLARTPAWTLHPVGSWGGVAVSLFDEPSSGIAAALKAPQIQSHFEWMQRAFGPYPYGSELRLAVAPTYWAGFEHPGNIALSETLLGSWFFTDTLTHTVMHELAHQWAGNYTTLKHALDFGWKEAMAEYLTFVSEDERIDHDTAIRTAKVWKYLALDARYYLVPEEETELFDSYGDAYGPGPLILFRQLEVMYGRGAVIAALVQLIGQPQARTLSMDDVRVALEASTGADLSRYFDVWVTGRGTPSWPSISADLRDPLGQPCIGGPCTLSVHAATDDNVPRGAAFTVRIHGAQAGEATDVLVSNGASGGDYPPTQVNLSFAPAHIEIDPNGEALVFPDGVLGLGRASEGVKPWRVR